MILDIRNNNIAVPISSVYLKTEIEVHLQQMPRQLFGGYALSIQIGDNKKEHIIMDTWDNVSQKFESFTEEALHGFVMEIMKKISEKQK